MRRLVLLALPILFAAVAIAVATCEGDAPPPSGPPEITPSGESAPADEPWDPTARVRRHIGTTLEATPEALEDAVSGEETWEILVLGPEDQPVPGVSFSMSYGGHGTSGSGGRARIPAPPAEGREGAQLLIFWEDEWVVPLEPRTVVRIERALPLVIELVDAETGLPLDGAVSLRTDAATIPLERQGNTHVLGAVPMRYRGKARLALAVPDVYSKNDHLVAGAVSRFATELHAVVAVPRDVRARIRVLDSDSAPAAGVRMWSLYVSGEYRKHAADATDERGETLLRGLPFFRGETLRVRMGKSGLWADSQTLVLRRADVEETLEVVLPDKAPTDLDVMDSEIADHSDWDENFVEKADPWHAVKVVVDVKLRSGNPARSVVVHLDGRNPRGTNTVLLGRAVTDAQGRATFEHLPAGNFVATAYEPGFVTAHGSATATDGEIVTIVIHEGIGRHVRLRVLDEEGQGVPFARVQVWSDHSRPYVRIVNGVQDLVLLTDARGELSLPGVPPGALRVRAGYGTRSGTADFEDASEITLRLGQRE